MKQYQRWIGAALMCAAMVQVGAVQASGPTSVIYDSVPAPLPPNVPSLGYEATSTAEFGDQVAFAGTYRKLSKVTVVMSAWGKQSEYPSMTNPAGWMHPITLKLYDVGAGLVPGSLIATVTQNFLVPWRPEPDPTCATPTAWRASNGNCYNGFAFTITFDLASQNLTLPNEIVYGIAYNTADYGANPIHAPGPYNSLNVGLKTAAPSVGSTNIDEVFGNSSWPGFYTDGGAGGLGIFRKDTGWTDYVPAVSFEAAVPLMSAKQDVLAMLAPQAGDKNVAKAIDHINKSLTPAYWADDNHLTAKGKKVFDEEKKAVHELMKVSPVPQAAIDALVAVDAGLAQTAIDEVACNGGAKCLDELAKANARMAKAADDLADGDYDKAIEDYKRAWEHARKAANKAVDPDDTE